MRASYWFVPTLMSIAAVALSIGMLQIDARLGLTGAREIGWLWAGGPDGARSILSTIASSMITVAGVVFSITIVALTLASSQFGPRLLRNFLRDSINQVVMGTFVATYLYCLLVLREVKSVAEQAPFVPYLSVTVAIALTTASLAMLILYIHHIARSIGAETLVANVAAELRESLQSLFPEQIGDSQATPAAREADDTAPEERTPVLAPRGGYIQAIEGDTLLALASEKALVVHLLRRPGDFIPEGAQLAEIWPAQRADDEAQAAVVGAHLIASSRTPRQDAEYCINQLVEIALRALSPGINDPFTAISCVHWLGDALGLAAQRQMPAPCRADEKGAVRVIAKVSTFQGLADAALNGIRQYGAANPAVAIAMLQVIGEIAPRVTRPEDRQTLLRHAEAIFEDAMARSPNPGDAADMQTHRDRVCRLYAA